MKVKAPRVEHIGEPSPRLVVEAVLAALRMEQGEERDERDERRDGWPRATRASRDDDGV
mgnify:CR=1 FL=1